jgi:hypothetical protein
MKDLRELLKESDPLCHEPEVSAAQRELRRQAVLGSASGSVRMQRSRFRKARLLVVPAAVAVILLLGSYVWSPVPFEARAEVRFEVRLAETAPGPGLREARVAQSERSVFLHEEVILTNGDIARAELIEEPGGQYSVATRFTAEGEQKIRRATAGHIGKPLAILIDNEVVMVPILRSELGGSAVITGNFTREEADRIAKGLGV